MELRHEWKHEINPCDLLTIRQRLRAIAQPDPHAVNGRYKIRSLYFDTPGDKALPVSTSYVRPLVRTSNLTRSYRILEMP